jgi:hypothetical protein
MGTYRDDREAAHARVDVLERENRDLRRQLEVVRQPSKWRNRVVTGLFFGVLTVLLGTLGLALFVARFQLVPPDIDARPGVWGTLQLEVSPDGAEARVDDRPWQSVNQRLNVIELDPNHPHQVQVRARGYAPIVRYVVVPANGIRREHIELRAAPDPVP